MENYEKINSQLNSVLGSLIGELQPEIAPFSRLSSFDFSLVQKGQTVGVALSGGMDSIALLFTLLSEAKRRDYKVVAVNVEHGIRGEQSKADSSFVKSICEKNGVPLYQAEVDAISYAKEQGLSLEESARILRYSYFETLYQNGIFDLLAVGHHMDDNAETVLLNILRGSGVNGARGIPKTRDYLIRPMLTVKREDIERFIADNDLPFVTDGTNADAKYSRNFIRLEVIPKLKEKFPSAVDNICRFAENMTEYQEDLNKMAEAAVKIDGENNPYILLSESKFPSVFKQSAKLALSSLGLQKDVFKANLDDITSLLKAEAGSSIDLKNGITAVRDYDRVTFTKKQAVNSFEIAIKEGEFKFANAKYQIKFTENRQISDNCLSLDFDKLPENAIIRTRADGDVFLRASGKVKLKEYLIDKKIPKRKRDELLFIASGSDILAVVPFECGKPLFVDGNTKKILTITRL